MLLSFTQKFQITWIYDEVQYVASDQRERAVKPLRKGTRYFFFFYAVCATGGWVAHFFFRNAFGIKLGPIPL